MNWQDDINKYSDPIAFMTRRGNGKAPYPHIKETIMVSNGKTALREIPDKASKVKITGNNQQWYEIDENDDLKENFYQVDYTQGVVFFDATANGATLTFEYYGKGAYYTPDSRVYLTKPNGVIQNANDKFNYIDTELTAQNNRVNTLIKNNPQPSEVVDMRIDKNGHVYNIARERINAEQEKIENAYVDANGDKFDSLKERIDSEQNKIEEAYEDANNFFYSTLKERIDAEQKKIEEAYLANDGSEYTSLKNRFDTVDTKIARLKITGVNTVNDLVNGDFKEGEYVQTLGYYNINDGGTAIYHVDKNSLSYNDLPLNNGLKAHLVFNDMINVLQLGAKGNGTDDDASIIQNALLLAKNKNGATVYIPEGKYYLTSSLIIYENTTLILSPKAELLRDHTGYILINGELGSQYSGYDGNGNITVKGGIWNGNGANLDTASTILSIAHSHNVILQDLILKDAVNNHGVEINSSKNVLIDNCKFLGFRNTNPERDYAEAINIDRAISGGFPAFGVYDETPCRDVTIQNCYFGKSDTVGMTGWGRGIGSHDSTATGNKHSNIYIINNKFEDTIQWAVYATHWDDSQITNNKIMNCGGGVRAVVANASMYRIIVSDNIIVNTGSYGLVNIGFAGTESYEIRSIDISNNIIYSASDKSISGIYAGYCNGCKIDGNTIRNASTDGITVRNGRYYTIVNNSIVSCAGDGIIAYTNILYSSITNNQIGYIGLNGIHVNDNVDTITISSNTISGVNGNNSGDADHIRITSNVNRINIIGNVCRDIKPGYIATKALYITSTCTDVNKSGNIFQGIDGGVLDNGVPTEQDSAANSTLKLLGQFYSKPTFPSSLNNLTDSGLYLSNDQVSGNPFSDSSSAVFHIYISDKSAIQLAIPFARTTEKTLKRRSKSDGSWSEWFDVATTPTS